MAHKFKGNVTVEGSLNLPNQDTEELLQVDSSGNVISSGIDPQDLENLLDEALLKDGSVPLNNDTYLKGRNAADDNNIDMLKVDDEDNVQMASFFKTPEAAPSGDYHVANKKYVDDEIASLPDPIFYAGTWNADTNNPDLNLEAARVQGALYRVTDAGTHDFDTFGGEITFQVGDKVAYNGSAWEKWDVQDNENTDMITEGSTNLYFTDERAQDAVGNILTSSDTIELTYDDAEDEITADVVTQMSITSDESGLKLSGDAATPGNSKYYGTDSSGEKGFHDFPVIGEPNDINLTTFNGSNDQSTPANVTDFNFASEVNSFKAWVSVEVDATGALFEAFEIQGVNKGTNWDIAIQSVGDNSQVNFSITSEGQIQYTSGDYAEFDNLIVKFRAITT